MKKQQKQKARTMLKGFKILGLGAGGLVGLFVLVFFALPAVCPSCASWIGFLPPSEPAQAQATNDGRVPVGTNLREREPDFALTDIDGNSFKLSDLRGQPTIVYFSASWCTPCIPETQALARLKDRYANLNILWISVDPAGDSAATLREHRRRYARPDFIYALDTTTNEIAKQYQVYALGTVYLLNKEQVIAFRGVRPVGSQAFDQALERVVK